MSTLFKTIRLGFFVSLLLAVSYGIAGAGNLTLTWNDNSNNEDGFKIERKEGLTGTFAEIAMVGANVSSYADTGLTDGTTYCYQVRAYNGAGDSPYTNEDCNTTSLPDIIPPNISAVSVNPISYYSATITWTTDEPADSQIEYGLTPASGSFTSLDSPLTTGHGQTLNGLTPSTLYYYRVISKDGSSNLATGSQAIFTTPDLPLGSITEEWGSTLTSNHPNTVEDTFLNLDTQNYSQEIQLNTYTWPTDQIANAILIKWDLSVIPQGATIQSATLSLFLQGNGGDASYDLSVHKVINKDPVISITTGFTYDGSNSWTANSCCFNGVPLAQGDIAVAEDVQTLDKTNGYKTWTVTQMVQDWVNNGTTNFGMMVNSDPVAAADSNRIFSSNEHSQINQRPKLVITYTATPSTFALTVAKAGSGSGTVTSSPTGIDCGSSCAGNYVGGTSLTLTATPAADSVFTGWTGSCSGTGPCTVNLTADTSVTANFTLKTFALTVSTAGNGSGTVISSPAGIDCGSDCSESYSSGVSITLMATPNLGYQFDGWSSGGCSGAGSCTMNIIADTSVTATFNLAIPNPPTVLNVQ